MPAATALVTLTTLLLTVIATLTRFCLSKIGLMRVAAPPVSGCQALLRPRQLCRPPEILKVAY